jgi:exosortase/archaeosortase
MKQIATMRATQAAAKYAENAPLATTCCNACRTCVQTNLLGIVLGAVAFVVAPLKRRLTKHF